MAEIYSKSQSLVTVQIPSLGQSMLVNLTKLSICFGRIVQSCSELFWKIATLNLRAKFPKKQV